MTFTKILNNISVLDDRIEMFSGLVKDHYEIEELFDPLRPTQVPTSLLCMKVSIWVDNLIKFMPAL